MLAQRLRRWPSIETTLCRSLRFFVGYDGPHNAVYCARDNIMIIAYCSSQQAPYPSVYMYKTWAWFTYSAVIYTCLMVNLAKITLPVYFSWRFFFSSTDFITPHIQYIFFIAPIHFSKISLNTFKDVMISWKITQTTHCIVYDVRLYSVKRSDVTEWLETREKNVI